MLLTVVIVELLVSSQTAVAAFSAPTPGLNLCWHSLSPGCVRYIVVGWLSLITVVTVQYYCLCSGYSHISVRTHVWYSIEKPINQKVCYCSFSLSFYFLLKSIQMYLQDLHRKHLHQPRKPRPAYSKTRWYNFHYLCPNISAHISHHKKCLIVSSFFFHFQWSYLQCIMVQ